MAPRENKAHKPPASKAAPRHSVGSGSGRFHKERRPVGEPVSFRPAHSPRFIPVPFDPPADLTLSLETILCEPENRRDLASATSLVFHCVGDTGGVYGKQAQDPVAHAMELQFDVHQSQEKPTFFYHLGDVVYFNGLERLYGSQFYEPYQYYRAPIFAIPGNHDGDTHTERNDPPDHEKSLTGFRLNFCAAEARHYNKYRELMTQPYVYWTLQAPFVTIVGLYSNVDGTLDGRGRSAQQHWFESQLASAAKDKWLLLAVHHGPYSLDSEHGGYPEILDALETAAQKSGRWPDAVLSGHVHNYQRFERTIGDKTIPFIIAGAGGYANTAHSLHKLQAGIPLDRPYKTAREGVVLMHCEQELPGFLRITVTRASFLAEYFTVPFGPPDSGVPTHVDSVSLKRRALEEQ
jgi:predicted phosphodiesterase